MFCVKSFFRIEIDGLSRIPRDIRTFLLVAFDLINNPPVWIDETTDARIGSPHQTSSILNGPENGGL